MRPFVIKNQAIRVQNKKNLILLQFINIIALSIQFLNRLQYRQLQDLVAQHRL